jgi:hypothetical protein
MLQLLCELLTSFPAPVSSFKSPHPRVPLQPPASSILHPLSALSEPMAHTSYLQILMRGNLLGDPFTDLLPILPIETQCQTASNSWAPKECARQQDEPTRSGNTPSHVSHCRNKPARVCEDAKPHVADGQKAALMYEGLIQPLLDESGMSSMYTPPVPPFADFLPILSTAGLVDYWNAPAAFKRCWRAVSPIGCAPIVCTWCTYPLDSWS